MLIDDLSILKYKNKLSKQLILKKPSDETIGVLQNSFDESLEADIIGVNSLSFKIHSKEHYAKDIKVGKQIHLKIEQEEKSPDGIGGYDQPLFYEEIFYISSIERNDGEEEVLSVTTKSIYSILGSKIIQGYSGIKKLFRAEYELISFVPGQTDGGVQYDTYEEYENSGILNYMMKLIPDWTLDYVSDLISDLYREVDFLEDSVLDVFTSFFPENYSGIVQFDTVNKTISVYEISEIGEDEGLIIESDQIAKNINTNTIDSEWVTKLYVYGAEGITVAPVNPTGDDYILNLSYVIDEEFMSLDLITAIDSYETYVSNNEGNFSTLLAELGVLEDDLNGLVDNKHLAELELEDLRIELDATIVRYATSDTTPTRTTQDIVSDINAKEREIGNTYTQADSIGISTSESVTLNENYNSGLMVYLIDNNYPELGTQNVDYSFGGSIVYDIDGTKYQKVVITYEADFGATTIEQQISSKEGEVDSKIDEIQTLRDSLKATNFFTEAEFNELQVFIREKVYRNDNITDRGELYQKGLEVLGKINSPQVEVDIDGSDFLNSLKYSTQ